MKKHEAAVYRAAMMRFREWCIQADLTVTEALAYQWDTRNAMFALVRACARAERAEKGKRK